MAILRTEAGRDPHDKALQDLATPSDEFRVRWSAHDVRHHASRDRHFWGATQERAAAVADERDAAQRP